MFSGQVTHVEWALVPLWLIALFPFLGAIINALFGQRLMAWSFGQAWARKWRIGSFGVSLVAIGAMLLSLAAATIDVLKLVSLEPGRRYLYTFAFPLVRIGSLDASFAFALDPLSGLLVLVVTFVGALIHVYAAAYMAKDPSYSRFFSLLNLFVAAMLLLILGDNFLVMFFGWEGVGLASYLLIGFWYRDYQKATAGMKAFVCNRIGDLGFLLGIALLFWGLSGRFLRDGSYQPDYGARFVAVRAAPLVGEGESAVEKKLSETRDEGGLTRASRRAGAKGALTMTSYAGAQVFLDIGGMDPLALMGPRPPKPFAVSPFVRKEIPTGVHNLLVLPGGGAVVAGDQRYRGDPALSAALASVAEIEHVKVGEGDEIVIAPLGSTLTFRELRDALVMKDEDGKPSFAEALRRKEVFGGVALVTAACLLLFLGVTGKSAQIPLFVWLPDAMAGPTPVSALIHAATMVTAGVYLIARLGFLFSLSPTASGIVALTGAFTALFAATIGLFQYDIKKVLAYSTISQLGFMILGVGAGAYAAGVFHLLTHAFFKACLFLAAGSVIHGMHAVVHGEASAQDMRNMGGLRRVMPKTARAYRLATIAITAAPLPFFSGFWSKDEILYKTLSSANTGPVPSLALYGIGLAAATTTSFYMWRSYYVTFEGPHEERAIENGVHESDPAMTLVLAVLAALSVLAGVVLGFSTHLVGGHGSSLLDAWLSPVFAHDGTVFDHRGLGLEIGSMILTTGLSLFAWSLARRRYGETRKKTWAKDEERTPGYALIFRKYYIDEIYEATVVRSVLALRLVFADMDRFVVDGILNGAAVLSRAAAWVTGSIDKYLVDGTVNILAEETLRLGARMRKLQTGRIQTYVYGLLGGVAFFAVLRYLLR